MRREGTSRTHAAEDLNSGPTLARWVRVRSPPRSSVRPSVLGVMIMDVSWGNAPFVDSFTVIIFLLACFAVNFGEHTRKEEETGEWAGEGGEERERDADVVDDHKTGGGGLSGPTGKQTTRISTMWSNGCFLPPNISATLLAFAVTSRYEIEMWTREMELVFCGGEGRCRCHFCMLYMHVSIPHRAAAAFDDDDAEEPFQAASIYERRRHRRSPFSIRADGSRAHANGRTMSSAKVDS